MRCARAASIATNMNQPSPRVRGESGIRKLFALSEALPTCAFLEACRRISSTRNPERGEALRQGHHGRAEMALATARRP